MEHWHRGQTSARFETDNRGTGWISSGKGDHGGVSYGSYQFASAVGGVDEYLKSSRYADQFHGLKPATEAFSERWKALAARDEKGFAQEQHDFIQHRYYDVQMDRLKKVGVDLQGRGPAVQDALWSTSVQYRNMTRGVFQNGLKHAYGDDYKLSELSDEQIVRAVQDYKHANVQRHFESSPKQWDSLRERTLNEKSELVALARYDRINHDPQPYPRYRAEARALVAWRDAVNQALEQLVLAPPDGIETWEQVRALLPQPETFAWPEKAELPLETGSPTVVF